MKKAAAAKEKKHKSRPVDQKALRVLLVEDNEDDALLLVRELKKGGYNPEYKRVETAEAMQKALHNEQWDIILCDYSLPKFNAPQAISLLRETTTDIPLIIVSGAIGEETAADCMILGARDFIRKNNLARLCPAVARELQEAATRCTQKLAQKALRESENFLASVFESIQDGISILDTKFNIIGVNETHKKWYMHKAPLVGKKCYQAYHDRKQPCAICPSRQTLRTGRPSSLIVPKENNNKVANWLEIYSFPLKDEATGEIRGVIEHVRDITGRKSIEDALEEQKRFSQTIVEESPTYFVAIGADGKTIMMNQALLGALGYTKKEVVGKNYLQTFVPKADQEALSGIFERLTHRKKPTLNENHILTKSGEEILVEWHGRPVFRDNGELDYFFGVGIDITQRNKAQEELKQSEEKYRLILSSIQEGYFEVDIGGTYTFVNDANCGLLGYTRDELIGMNYRQHMDKENAEKLRKPYTDLYRTGKPIQSLEVDSYKKDGAKVSYETSVSLIKDAQGKPVGFRGVSRDITERKRAEAALKHSEEKYRHILENIEDGYYETDLQGNLTFFNDAACRISGYTSEESMGMNFRQHTPENDADKVYSIFHEVYKTGIPVKGLSHELIRKDKTSRYVETSITLRKNSDGRKIGFQGIVRDVTERKKAEESLKQSEYLLRKSQEVARLGSYNMDAIKGTWISSPVLDDIFGIDENFPKNIDGWAKLIHPDDRDTMVAYLQDYVLAQKHSFEKEYRIIRQGDNREHWVLGLGELSINKDGRITNMIGTIQDITERKFAEEELRKKHEELETIIESSPIMIYFKDTQSRFTRVNKTVLQVSGLTKSEIEGKSNEEINPRQAAKFLQEDREIIATGKPKIGTYEVIKTRKGKKVLLTDKVPYRDKEGNIIGVIGFSVDITEQQKAQDALQESKERYRSLVENAQEGVYQSTRDGRYLTVNPAFARILGYDSAQEIIQAVSNISAQLYVHPEDRQRLLKLIDKYGSIADFETEFYRKNGTRVWLSVSMHAVRNPQGEILYYQGMTQDITEKKKMNAERQEHLKKLRQTLGATINAMAVTVETRDPYTAGHQRRVSDLARAIATEMKLSSDQIEGVRMASVIHDIGKISIPSEILTKPTQLSQLEYDLIKTHPSSGHAILKDIDFPWPISRIVLEHHERIDGSGYPCKLKGEDILLESRILAVADVVEAISSHRPYRAAYGIEAGLKEIEKNKGTLYDTGVVDACLRLFREKRYTLPA